MPEDLDLNLELLRQKMDASQAKTQAFIHSYKTDQGTVFRLPDFEDPAVLEAFVESMHDAHKYFSAAKHLKHLTT